MRWESAQRIGITHDPIAAPDESHAEDDRHAAVETLDPSLALGRERAQDEVRPNMAIGPDKLARGDEDRPDREIDHHLVAPGKSQTGVDIAPGDLKDADRQGACPEHADQQSLHPIPPDHFVSCPGMAIEAWPIEALT